MSDEDMETTYGYEVGQRCVSSEVPFAWINVHIIYPNYITCSVAVYPIRKGVEEWMKVIYGMEKLNLYRWTSVQKLHRSVLTNS